MLDFSFALLTFAFASFSVLVTAGYLRTSLDDIENAANKLSDASKIAVLHLHEGVPYFTDQRTAAINRSVAGYIGLVEDVFTFLLWIRGTEKDVPPVHGTVRKAAGQVSRVVRIACVTLGIGICSLTIVPILALVLVCEMVHLADGVLRSAGVGSHPITREGQKIDRRRGSLPKVGGFHHQL